MIAAAAGIWVDIHYKIDKQLAELYFGIIAIIWSILVFGVSYFSRPTSMFFVCGALSYSVVWTICYVITVTCEVSIHWLIYLLSTVFSFILISIASNLNPKLREKYSFVIYTSITNPFFLCMSIAVYFKLYVDVITYSQYKEWRREDQIRPYAWVFVPVQIVLTYGMCHYRISRMDQKSQSNGDSSYITQALTGTIRAEKDYRYQNDAYNRPETENIVSM